MRYSNRCFAPARASHLAEFDDLEDAKAIAYAEFRAEIEDGPRCIFSREPYADCASRKWCVCTFAEMAAWMSRKTAERRVHEWVGPDVLCKFAADLDRKRGEHDDAFPRGETDLVEVVQELRERVASVLGLVEQPRAVVSSGSRPGKDSLHVVFPEIVFENWAAVTALGYELTRLSETAGTRLRLVLDMNVYARRSGTLRTLYSTACDKETYMVPLGDPQDAPFNRSKWLESLITYVPPSFTQLTALPAALQRVAVEAAQAQMQALTRSVSSNVALPDAFVRLSPNTFEAARACMARYYSQMYLADECAADWAEAVVQSDRFGFFFRHFPCVFKRGSHATNRVLVLWRLNPPAHPRPANAVMAPRCMLREITMQCMNKRCKRPRWEATPVEVARAEAALRSAIERADQDREAAAEAEAAAGAAEGAAAAAVASFGAGGNALIKRMRSSSSGVVAGADARTA
jgi:hypothetical protein